MLFDVYNEPFKVGSLPQLMHSGLITFIPKTVKDPLDPSGYRPISLHIFGISMGKININIYKMQMICCYL